eukprot:CAMPEP_0119467328 /NCGR_PEP_ID=MMETSP1344-20130328/1565_1 /TAXON_ID=236787 /ORGANISM="Florenciella parvula, Strain CCMP2471" /LENGTH=72 /DNA_ID=CAMNT_0007499685 /DNA_START=554 /DNA_END=770 /DNA_ORIENTATION=+
METGFQPEAASAALDSEKLGASWSRTAENRGEHAAVNGSRDTSPRAAASRVCQPLTARVSTSSPGSSAFLAA